MWIRHKNTNTSSGLIDKLVKSSPFHGGVTGSSPVEATKIAKYYVFKYLFIRMFYLFNSVYVYTICYVGK
nr:MAG TPA: hypothetical protein [Bacteriophage sp.]